MRNAFARVMTELAKERNDVCLLSGDIGNRMFDQYKEVAPTRFLNCGIAEANMMSMAAGMALNGLKPVVYTITPFTTTRCLEQIRTGVAYHEAPVVIVGTGSGLSYAELGATHHSLEDLAILRSIPNLQVCAPCDSLELEAQLRQAIFEDFPTYIRIGKKGEPILHPQSSELGIGKSNFLRQGTDLLVLGVGPILLNALNASEILANSGVSVAVASMGSVKPIDYDFLKTSSVRFKKWISLEEHCINGGLGSVLLEFLSDNNLGDIELIRLGTSDSFIHELGDQEFVRKCIGLDVNSLSNVFSEVVRS